MLGYRQVASSRPVGGEPEESRLRAVEMRLSQDVPGAGRVGRLRFLLALRLGSVETPRVEQWESGDGNAETLEALNRRVAAGVSVQF